MFSDEETLGATDCRSISQETHVAGQTEPAWVGSTLAIAHKEIRPAVQLIQSRQKNRRFPKRE
jgi:hypothetical protein